MKEIIRTLKPYIPEEPAEAVKERLGIDRLVRLSANENPYGTSPLVRDVYKRQVLKSIIFQALNQIFKSSWIAMVR